MLAASPHGTSCASDIAGLRLRDGDVLLLQGSPEGLALLQSNESIWALGELGRQRFRRRRGSIALVALLGAVAAAAVGWVPVSVALLVASLAASLAALLAAVIPERDVVGRVGEGHGRRRLAQQPHHGLGVGGVAAE